MSEVKIIRGGTDKIPPVRVYFEEDTLTKQSFRDECNINNIMAKYIRTGVIDHANNYQAEYGFALALDYREANEIIIRADAMFLDLPSSVRERFDNDPAEFLAFVQDEANLPEMQEMGLVSKPEPIQEPEPAPLATDPPAKPSDPPAVAEPAMPAQDPPSN